MSTVGVFALLGLFLVQRRAAGALVQPLSLTVLIALGLILASVAWACRRTLPVATFGRNSRFALWLVPTIVLVIWLAAICLPGTSAFGLTMLLGVVLAEEAWSAWGLYGQVAAPESMFLRELPGISRADVLPMGSRTPVISHLPDDAVEDNSPPDESITQQLTRRRDDASESIEGWVRVDFAVGQRHAAAHLAICPPLDRLPECFAEPSDGPAATVKVGQVLTHGVRFDVKLDQPTSEPACVLVEFSLQSPGRN